MQLVSAQFNGGPLGGAAVQPRYTGEIRALRDARCSSAAARWARSRSSSSLGLSARGGVVFGDPGGFFISQKFSLGGVQYGEQLRGYEEFSITPQRVHLRDVADARRSRSRSATRSTRPRSSSGFASTSSSTWTPFYDAGNIWARPQDFDPTRLFRGAGFGGSLVTPLGPLGLDWGYGFDRVDATASRSPSGSCTSSSVSSSNLEYSCVHLLRAAPLALALLIAALRCPRRAQGSEGRRTSDSASCSTRRPAAPRPRRSSTRKRAPTASRSSG